MNRNIYFRSSLLVLAIVALLASGCQKDEPASSAEITINNDFPAGSVIIPGKYIVSFHQDALPTDLMNTARSPEARKEIVSAFSKQVLAGYGIEGSSFDHIYDAALAGFAGSLSAEAVALLSNDRRVRMIEPDQFITLGRKPKPNTDPNPPAQVTPWGITRVGGELSYSGGKKAWVVDSGIDLDHPDLNVNAQASVTMLGGSSTPDDQNGHGTHVAGTIGALNNSIGVIGVAPGVELISVRVLNRQGSGTLSGVIAGVNHVASYAAAGDVANMSLGGGVSPTLDNAVIAAALGGVYFVLAAGNSAADANFSSPARANGNRVYTISAMNASDYWASFSNYGSPVDFCAPGVNIHSCWKNGAYNTINGTSMAAPHISGVILVNAGAPSTDGYVQGDPDNNPDPIGHTN